jgi:hypothetical protein
MQTKAGRDGSKYDYARAAFINNRICINGRMWMRATIFDFVQDDGRLGVGQVREFVVVEYTHKDIERKRGRIRASNLQGTIVFVRARQYNPTPQRDAGMWVAPAKPNYHLRTIAVAVKDLCSYLHSAPERDGQPRTVNLVKVATAFV